MVKFRKIRKDFSKYRKFITNFQKTVKFRKIRKFRTTGRPAKADFGQMSTPL